VRGELFSAHLGGGARRDAAPVAVSACTSLPDALVVTGFSGASVELPCPENHHLAIAATPGVFDPLWALVQFAAA
jgi:fructose-1,6-bisphosphatase/inositol monophosphatase family enzyme